MIPVSPDPRTDNTESATEHSMRWEDDGGPAVDVETPGTSSDRPDPA